MESELPRTQGHHYDSLDLSVNSAELHSEGHSEGHQEKPSMFKRVKAKARKIKNSLTSHGHSHSQDECEEDEDEEMVEDSKNHSAPIYGLPAPCKPVDTGSGEDVHHEMPHKGINTGAGRDVFEERENPDQVGGPNAMEGIHGPIGTTGSQVDPQGPDIRAHPSNVQIKTIDPANRGNEEAEGITPVITSLNKIGISEETPKTVGISEDPIYEAAADKGAARASDGQSATGETNLDSPSMVGSHYDPPIVDAETRPFVQGQADEDHGKHLLKEDKHAPVPCKPVDTRSGEDVHHELPHKGINTGARRDVFEERENPDQVGGPNAMEGIHGAIGTIGSEVDPQGPDIRAHPSNVQIKTIDPASRGNEEAEGITPVITSFNKMGISEEKPKTVEISEEKPKSEQGEELNTGSHDQFAPDPMPHESSESLPKSYNAANPQDMPEDVHDPTSQSSTYTEKITPASAATSSAIAGTAQSSKNAIASKIGQTREPGQGSEPGEGNRSGSVIGTEPGEGNRPPSGMGTASDYDHSGVSGLGAETTQENGGSVGKDKGVSVKEYCEEKLKPGEDDKALSSKNTESFSKPKGEKIEEVPSAGGGGHDISQIVSDAVHKGEPEESEEPKPMGKVTESEEVAKRLGTGEEGSGLGNIGSGAGMVSKLTGAIGSWFGGQGGGAQSTPGTTLADDNEGDMGKNADAQGRHQE